MNRSFLITGDSINSRLDRWLKRNISPIPQSLIEKNLRKGKIKVNDKKIKSSYRLQKNDKINFYNFTFKARLEKKKKFIYDPSKKDLLFSLTISRRPIYLTGLKKCVIQKSFLSASVSFSDSIFRGIVEVFDETIEFFFLFLNICS